VLEGDCWLFSVLRISRITNPAWVEGGVGKKGKMTESSCEELKQGGTASNEHKNRCNLDEKLSSLYNKLWE
jgi:hypothetical protein